MAAIDANSHQISKNRRIALSEFKGKQLINIREYYEKNDQMLPGKKVCDFSEFGKTGSDTVVQGISLTPEQFSTLIELLPQLETTLQDKGTSIPRPNYTDDPASKAEADEDVDDDKADDDIKKNHEATSEEDE